MFYNGKRLGKGDHFGSRGVQITLEIGPGEEQGNNCGMKEKEEEANIGQNHLRRQQGS